MTQTIAIHFIRIRITFVYGLCICCTANTCAKLISHVSSCLALQWCIQSGLGIRQGHQWPWCSECKFTYPFLIKIIMIHNIHEHFLFSKSIVLAKDQLNHFENNFCIKISNQKNSFQKQHLQFNSSSSKEKGQFNTVLAKSSK